LLFYFSWLNLLLIFNDNIKPGGLQKEIGFRNEETNFYEFILIWMGVDGFFWKNAVSLDKTWNIFGIQFLFSPQE